MLPVGVIGAGPEWESTWRPALVAQSRLKTVALYDPVAVRGEAAARDLEAPLFAGVRELLARTQLRGLLLLDSGWLGASPVQDAARHHVPVFVTPPALDMEQLVAVPVAALGELLVQPDLRRRYTPATMRLRELTATRLGPIGRLAVEVPAVALPDLWHIAELIDWCRFVIQSAIVESSADWYETEAAPIRTIRLVFRRTLSGQPVTAELRLMQDTEPADVMDSTRFSAEVSCSHGTALLRGTRQIQWRMADESGDERLSDDRSSGHVQLDLFGRRLVGGLVPAATLEDVRTAMTLAHAALHQA